MLKLLSLKIGTRCAADFEVRFDVHFTEMSNGLKQCLKRKMFVQFWQRWREATSQADTTSTLLLTTPVEHIRDPHSQSEQVELNALSIRMARSFGPASGWQAIDFANLTATLQPANLLGNNWHYVCTLYPYYGRRVWRSPGKSVEAPGPVLADAAGDDDL